MPEVEDDEKEPQGHSSEDVFRRFANIVEAYEEGRRKAREELFGGYHERSLLLQGFLGGLVFSTLVVAISAKSSFDITTTAFGNGYFDWVVGLLSTASISSIFGAFVNVYANTFHRDNRWLMRFALLCLALTLVAIVYVIPLLILPIMGPWVSIGIFLAMVGLFGLIFLVERWA